MTAAERHAKHRKTEKFKANRRRYIAAYRKTARGREVIRRSWLKYNADPAKNAAIKAKRDKYRASAKYPVSRLRQSLARKYGMTVVEYQIRLSAQMNVCAICEGINLGGRRLCVDHEHSTGKVRGLLCSSCNTMLGRAKDKAVVLRRAAEYVENFILAQL